jgi:uncharacterized protein
MTTLSVHATTRQERIQALDVLRGFALLGILVLNINYFAGPEAGHDIPYGAFTGPHSTINLVTFYIKWMFFEAKMRGLFSMLFGAGVILLTDRMTQRGAGSMAADIFLRRNMILVVLGVLHWCLIWDGDILFDYGLVALLALYPLRNLSAKTQLWTGSLLSLFAATFLGLVYIGALHDIPLQPKAALVEAHQKAGIKLTAQEEQIARDWKKAVEDHQASPEKVEKRLKEAKVGYLEGVLSRSADFRDTFFRVHITWIADDLSAMMIGMGLMRMGFLTGQLSFVSYALTALIGFVISLPLYAVGIAKTVASRLDFIEIDKWLFAPYYLTREPGMIAIAACIIMLIKSGHLRKMQRLLANVGQTALTNYLATSVLCQTLFVWGPWDLYGKLEYYQLNYVVAAIWALNLTLSALWLRFFSFGPVEWVWRSLTYLRVAPMRRTGSRPFVTAPGLSPAPESSIMGG